MITYDTNIYIIVTRDIEALTDKNASTRESVVIPSTTTNETMANELATTTDPVVEEEPTFSDVARKVFYRGPEQFGNDDERVKKDTVLFLTPLAATASHFVHPHQWQALLGQVFKNDIPDEYREHASIVKSLYNITHTLGGKLINSANGRDNRERLLAQLAWKTAPPTARMNHDWCHMLMLHLVMDRVLFAFGDIDYKSKDDRPLQTGLIKPFPIIPEMKKIHDKFVNWKDSTTDFLDLWERAYAMNNNRSLFPNICETPNDLDTIGNNTTKGTDVKAQNDDGDASHILNGDGDEVLNSLVGGLRQTHTASRVNTIFNNFSMTALALRALVLVSRSITISTTRFKPHYQRGRNLTNEDSTIDTQSSKKTFEEIA